MKRLTAGLEVRTTDLRPGDVLVYADLVDTVVSVSDLGGCMARVDVIRNGKPTFWFAGKRAEHEVLGPCFCPGDCGCRSQGAPFFRPMFCGCRAHVVGHAGRLHTGLTTRD